MKSFVKVIGLTAMLSTSALATVFAADTVKFASVLELSGPGATTGANWRDGQAMAVEEVNAKGGILGHRIDLSLFDTQTNPGVSRAQVQKALAEKPYVVLGPIYSGSTKVNMELTQKAKVPQLTGSQAPEITATGNPYIFRTTFNTADVIPLLSNYIETLKAKKVGIIWANNDFGKGGASVFREQMKARNIEIVVDQSAEQGQSDFTPDISAASQAKPDVLFVYLNEEEAARFLIQSKRADLDIPLVGATTLLNDKVLELAGDAANGVRGLLELSAKAPLPEFQSFVKRFTEKYKRTPDHAAAAGYLAVYTVKVATEKQGELNSEKLGQTLHGLTVSPQQEPGVLMETTWAANGDISRQAFIAEIVDGKQVIRDILPKLNK